MRFTGVSKLLASRMQVSSTRAPRLQCMPEGSHILMNIPWQLVYCTQKIPWQPVHCTQSTSRQADRVRLKEPPCNLEWSPRDAAAAAPQYAGYRSVPQSHLHSMQSDHQCATGFFGRRCLLHRSKDQIHMRMVWLPWDEGCGSSLSPADSHGPVKIFNLQQQSSKMY